MSDTTYVTFAVRAKDENHPVVQRLIEDYVEEKYIEDGVLTLCCPDLDYAGHAESLGLISAGVPFVRHSDAGDNYCESVMVHLAKGEVLECPTSDREPITVVRVLGDGTILLPGLPMALKVEVARKAFYDMCMEDAHGNNKD